MDKYELRVSLDEIDRLISERRFAEAAEVADTIEWERVKGVHVLCRISDLYKINKRYKDSRDLLEIAYERNPSSRKIIYSLCELELKLNNYIHALQLYNAFINVAPRDPDRYLLQYKLYKKQDVNVYEQIAVLEEFLQRDFRERWAYELAVLYQRAGEEQRCISQCDEIVAYFGDGRFVIRALELKQSLTALTPQQEERLEILKSGGRIEPPAPEQSEQESDEQTGAEPEESEDGAGTGSDAAENASEADLEEEPAKSASDEEKTAEAAEDKKASPDDGVVPEAVEDTDSKKDGVGTSDDDEEDADSSEPSATPEDFTDTLLRDAKMEETIARGMREIGDGDYDSVLAQETNGQLAMVIEEGSPEETQVEGQLDLAQIMSEWEKIRKDSEQQRLAEARRRVMERSQAVKRELYGEDFQADGSDDEAQENPSDAETQTSVKTGTTRSWKKEDVEKGLRGRKS